MTDVAAGAVYDRGYRPYDGPRLGRSGARRALYWSSIRRALGLGRSWRQKVLPWSLLVVTTIPAIVNIGVAYVTDDTPIEDFEFLTYREYVGVSTALLLFVAISAPDIICPDRRYRTLSLILARPLTGLDYIGVKLGAVISIVFAFGLLPQTVLFAGRMFVDDDALGYASDNAAVLWQAPVSVLLLATYLCVVAVAIASYTTRRVVAAAGFLGTLFVSGIVSAILVGERPVEPSHGELANLLTIPLKLRDVVFDGQLADDTALSGATAGGWWALLVYVAVLGIAAAATWRRFESVDA